MGLSILKKAILALSLGTIAVLLARLLSPAIEQPVSRFTVKDPQISVFLQQNEKNNIEVFQEVSPSVVYISSSEIKRDYFSLNAYEIPQGAGTGFVWNTEGYIVTNFHVIGNADRVMISLINQKQYSATFVGGDPDKDLAVLKIDAPPASLKPIQFSESEILLVGQKTIAIGNPFGLDHTMTVGIISALDREIESLTGKKIMGAIQTDAAINPGNSGGPLLNANGKMIGVNTQILSNSGSSSGIGFAIPIKVVKDIVPQLIKYGRVRRVGLGVIVLSESFRYRLQLHTGVMIRKVKKSSSAWNVGLRGIEFNSQGQAVPGHVILAINGQKVHRMHDLSEILGHYKVEDEVVVEASRLDKVKKFKVVLQIIE